MNVETSENTMIGKTTAKNVLTRKNAKRNFAEGKGEKTKKKIGAEKKATIVLSMDSA
jgi:hypothetical protein